MISYSKYNESVMDLCVNFGCLDRRPWRFILGFGSSRCRALPRSFHEGRPGPLTPIYHCDGPPRRQHRQHTLLRACKQKFTPWSYRNARMPARFFRFPYGRSHSSYSGPRKENAENAVVNALYQMTGVH